MITYILVNMIYIIYNLFIIDKGFPLFKEYFNLYRLSLKKFLVFLAYLQILYSFI